MLALAGVVQISHLDHLAQHGSACGILKGQQVGARG